MFKFNHNLLAYKLSVAQQLPVLEKVGDPISQAIQQSIAVSCTLFIKSGKKSGLEVDSTLAKAMLRQLATLFQLICKAHQLKLMLLLMVKTFSQWNLLHLIQILILV